MKPVSLQYTAFDISEIYQEQLHLKFVQPRLLTISWETKSCSCDRAIKPHITHMINYSSVKDEYVL